jgi:hypothetical protein
MEELQRILADHVGPVTSTPRYLLPAHSSQALALALGTCIFLIPSNLRLEVWSLGDSNP